MVVEIARPPRLAFAFQVLRRRHGDDRGNTDPARDQARIRERAIADGKIDAFFDEIAGALRTQHFNHNLWIALAEERKSRHDKEAGKCVRRSDPYHTRRRGLAGTDTGFGSLEIAD